jgi:hypothetical protein
MTHRSRVNRHIGVDALASSAGGAFIAAIIEKSMLAFVLLVLLSIALFFLEKENIEDEEAGDA